MMMKSWIYIFCIILSALSSSCRSEDDLHPDLDPGTVSWEDVHYHKENSKLPDNQVTALVKAENGTIWVGTDNGLAQIKNDHWQIFKESNQSLPSSHIRALSNGRNGKLWVGTDRGLSSYDGANWLSYNKENCIMTSNKIKCINYDKNKNITWFATESELISINHHNDQWRRYDIFDDLLILSMAVAPDGSLWLGAFDHIGFRGKLLHLEGEKFTTIKLDEIGYPSTFPYSIAINQNNAISVVLTGTSVKTVLRLEGQTRSELQLPSTMTGLRALMQDGDYLWIGGNGLAVNKGGATQAVNFSLSGSTITAMISQNSHHKWIGTVDRGLILMKSNL